MLQCVLTGKAQQAFSAVSLEDSRHFETVKAPVLRAYELISEAYHQRIKHMKKRSDQSNVESVRDLCLQCHSGALPQMLKPMTPSWI